MKPIRAISMFAALLAAVLLPARGRGQTAFESLQDAAAGLRPVYGDGVILPEAAAQRVRSGEKRKEEAPDAIRRKHTLDLKDFRGATFLEAMTAPEAGIKAALDSDWKAEYAVADWETVRSALEHFDGKVRWKILKAFPDGEEGLRRLAKSLEGESFTPETAVKLLREKGGVKGREVYELAQFFALASGAGTLVRINEDSYYYNYGYESGEEKDDVKSGRSFCASLQVKANDASDVFFLTELDGYLSSTRDQKPFYRTLLKVLTQSDPSGFGGLSDAGETVATCFLAIYTAELDRHIMVDLHPRIHPWENDLAEVTFVSAYGVAAGRIMKEGELVEGEAKEYWAKSEISNRSGIGQTRKDRRELQRLISDYERLRHPELVEPVEKAIGGRGPRGDLFRGVMEFLNDYDNQGLVRKNASALTEAFAEFLDQVRRDADGITEFISKAES